LGLQVMENYYRESFTSPFRAVAPKKTDLCEIEGIISFYLRSKWNVLKHLSLIDVSFNLSNFD